MGALDEKLDAAHRGNNQSEVLRMHPEHLKDRFHKALHRSSANIAEKELEQIVAVTLLVVGELAAEMALVVTELVTRFEALESGAHPAGAAQST